MEPSTPDAPPQRIPCGGALRSKDSATFEYRTVRIQQNRQMTYSSSTSSSSTHSASMSALSSSTKSRASNASIMSNVGSIATDDIDQPYQQQQCAQFSAAKASRMMMTTSMMRQNPAITLLGPGGTTNYHQRCKL